MTIPFPTPENANEARGNMIYWAEMAERTAVAGAVMAPGMAAIEKAKMWAAIALTLPEAEYTELRADDRVITRLPDVSAYMPSSFEVGSDSPLPEPTMHKGHIIRAGAGTSDTTIDVDSLAWDVLRALAARYVLSSLDKQVRLTLDDIEAPGWDLVLKHDRPTSVVTATVEPLP